MAGDMAVTGNVEPITEKLSAAHRLHILIDIRNDGVKPKAVSPKPCDANTVRKANAKILAKPAEWGKPR